jgi:hypothetical protein
MTAPGSEVRPDWQTRPQAREVTIVRVGPVEVVLSADGSVRVRHGLSGPQSVRVSRDGPGGFRTESAMVQPYQPTALLVPVSPISREG